MSEKKAPKLRFKGFTDDWEQRKFNEVIKVNSGRDYKHLDEGNIPVYGTGGYMLSVNDKLSDTDAIGIGRKGTINKPQYLKAPFWTVDTLFYVTPLSNSNLLFLFSLAQNIRWKTLDESTGVPSLSKKSIEKITRCIPTLEEQQEIGALFKKLEDVIALHQRKIKILKTLKKAYLQQMFPHDDENIPKLRFLNFNMDWEKRKLGNEVNFFSGLTYSPEDIRDKGTFVLRSSNVKNNEIISADDVFVNSDVVNSDQVKLKDIIVVVRNGSKALIGKHAMIKQKMPNTVIGAFMTGIRAQEPDFINATLDSVNFSKEIEKNLGATINQITTGAFKAMSFKIPLEKKEQSQIGGFFKNLDDLIALHQNKIERLKLLKEGYLQKMFI